MERVEPVDRDPAAHHVEVGIRAAQRRGAVGRMEAERGVLGTHGAGEVHEPLELLVEVPRARLVRRREVRPEPRELDGGLIRGTAKQLGHHPGVALAEAPHPGVVLHVDPRRDAQRAGPRRDGLEEAGVPHGDLRAGLERQLKLVVGERAHRQERRLDPGRPQLARLSPGRHRQHARSALHRRRGALGRAVAVCVGLDHGAHLGARGEIPHEPADVALDGAGVDQGDRPGPRPHARPPGRPSMTSLAITDSGAPIRSAAIRPARRWASTPAQAAS